MRDTDRELGGHGVRAKRAALAYVDERLEESRALVAQKRLAREEAALMSGGFPASGEGWSFVKAV